MHDIIYVLVIAALVASRVVAMIAARRNKSAGSRLHLRLTGVFGLLALIPTVAVAVFDFQLGKHTTPNDGFQPCTVVLHGEIGMAG